MVDNQTVVLDVALSETVGGTERKNRNKRKCAHDDMYLTFEGKVPRGSDALRSGRMGDGGGVHKKKSHTKRKRNGTGARTGTTTSDGVGHGHGRGDPAVPRHWML